MTIYHQTKFFSSKESLVQKISSKSYFDHTSPHCDLDDTLIAIHLFGLTLQLMMMHHCTKFDYQRLSGPKIYIFRQNLDTQILLFQYPPTHPPKKHTKNTLLLGDIMNQTDIIQGEKEQLRDHFFLPSAISTTGPMCARHRNQTNQPSL